MIPIVFDVPGTLALRIDIVPLTAEQKAVTERLFRRSRLGRSSLSNVGQVLRSRMGEFRFRGVMFRTALFQKKIDQLQLDSATYDDTEQNRQQTSRVTE